ncbi:MAG: VWA domain-containing protein [Acidobacteriota bacterium]
MSLGSLPRTSRGTLVIALLLFGAVGAEGQEDIAYGERVDVRVVNLDVLVLDKKGRPVYGLTQEDFNITEDGRIVDVQFFNAPSAPGKEPEPAASEPSRAAGQETERPVAELVVLLDDLNLMGPARNRFLQDLRQLLEGLEPLPPTLLLQRRRSLPILHGPTRDLDQLLAGLDGVGKPLAQGTIVSTARVRTLDEIRVTIDSCLSSGRELCPECFSDILTVINSYAIQQTSKVENVAAGLLGALGSMGVGQSQRTLLYVGDGLPQIPGLPMFDYLGDMCPDRRGEALSEALRYKQDRLFDELGAIANASRVSLYLYDAGGLRTTTSSDVRTVSISAPGGNREPGSTNTDFQMGSDSITPTPSNDNYFNLNQQAGMNALARATGGRAIVNTNRALEPMQTMVEDRAARYSLAFSIDREATGRLHELRVSLRPGVAKGRSLRYRRSFLDMTAEGRLLQRLNAALYAGAVSESFPVEVSFGEIERLARKKRRVPVQISVPESAFTVLPGPPDGRPRGAARIALASTDERDRLSGYRQRILELGEGGVVPTAEGDFALVVSIDVEPGSRIFAVAVRDETTGETTLVRSTLEVP